MLFFGYALHWQVTSSVQCSILSQPNNIDLLKGRARQQYKADCQKNRNNQMKPNILKRASKKATNKIIYMNVYQMLMFLSFLPNTFFSFLFYIYIHSFNAYLKKWCTLFTFFLVTSLNHYVGLKPRNKKNRKMRRKKIHKNSVLMAKFNVDFSVRFFQFFLHWTGFSSLLLLVLFIVDSKMLIPLRKTVSTRRK